MSPDHSELICIEAAMITTIFHLMVDLGQLYEGIIWCLSHTAINTPSHLYSWAGLCNIGFASPMAPDNLQPPNTMFHCDSTWRTLTHSSTYLCNDKCSWKHFQIQICNALQWMHLNDIDSFINIYVYNYKYGNTIWHMEAKFLESSSFT